MVARQSPRLLSVLLLLLCAGCGGGGGSSQTAPPPAPQPAPQPPPANRAPIVLTANKPQYATELHPFSYDPTQNGKTFVDLDGDPLQYSVTISYVYDDLRVQGTNI